MDSIKRSSVAGFLGCMLCALSAAATADLHRAPENPKAAAANTAFEALVDDFVFGTLALSPVTATGFGYHRYHDASLDDLLDDFSPEGIAASRGLLQDIESRIARLDTRSLDAEQTADVDIMRNALGATRLELDEIQSYRHNPTTYVELIGNALYSPYVLDFAPVPERYRHIINRLNKVPDSSVRPR